TSTGVAPSCVFRNQSLTPEGSADGPAENGGIDLALKQAAVGGAAQELAALGDDLAAQERHHRPARDRPPFPGAVVAHVEVLAGERPLHAGVDQDEVGVAAGGDHALLRIEAEDPR